MKRNRFQFAFILLAAALCLCMITACSADELPAEAADLIPDTPMEVAITDGEQTWFRFIPEETAVYQFSSSDGRDTYASLYEKTGDEISFVTYDDDSGDGNNFQIRTTLTAGTEYYFSVCAYNDGTFSVTLEKFNGLVAAYRNGESEPYALFGETVQLGVDASSGKGEVTYRWAEREEGGMWAWIEGETDPQISVTAGTRKQYRCRVTDGETTEILSYMVQGADPVEAEADSETDFAIEPGASAEMKVRASSISGLLTYEWYEYWYDQDGHYHEKRVDGADSAIYTAEEVQADCAYRCRVSSASDSTSVGFSIFINAPVTVDPVGSIERTVAYGGSAEMAVAAEQIYGPLSYQWYTYDDEHGATAIEGATENAYTAESILYHSVYSCKVTNAYGKTAECNFYISIEGDYQASAMYNDMIAEPGGSCELEVYTYAPGDVLTYQWYGPVPDKRETPQMIPGETGNIYTIEEATTAGYYLCRVRNAEGREKNVWIRVGIATDLAPDMEIDTVYGNVDEEIVLSASATSSAGEVTYQWYIEDDEQSGFEYSHAIEGATSETYAILNPEKPTAYYYCLVSDIYGNTVIVTRYVTITGIITIGETSETEQYVTVGDSVTLTVNASGSGELSYQWQTGTDWWEDFQDLEGENGPSCTIEDARSMILRCYIYSSFNIETYVDFQVYASNNLYVFNDGWAYVVPNETATLTARASCTKGEISYQWYEVISDIFGEKTDLLIPGATETSYTTEPITENKEYVCRVRDEYGNTDSTTIPICIDNQLNVQRIGPETVYVEYGSTAELKVLASARTGEVRYQWLRGSGYEYIAIPDATGNTFTTEAITGLQQFGCEVTDIYGNTDSVYFQLVIDSQLTVEGEDFKRIYVELNESVTLSVSASVGMGEIHYEWYDDQYNLIEGADGPTITTKAADHSMEYRCDISDDYGNTKFVYFYVMINNDFQAWAVGPTTLLVQPGESVTLQVGASAKYGELRYQWIEDLNGSLPPIYGATEPVYTIRSVNWHRIYYCRIQDEYGNTTSVQFIVDVNSGLTAEAAGPTIVMTEPGGTATFTVNASVNIGEVHYEWYADYGSGYRKITDAVQNTFTTEEINSYSRFYCTVSDDYRTRKTFYFAACAESQETPISFHLTDGTPAGESEDAGFVLSRFNASSSMLAKVFSCTQQQLDNGYSRFTVRYTMPAGLWLRVFVRARPEVYDLFNDPSTVTSSGIGILQFDIPDDELNTLSAISISFNRTDGYGLAFGLLITPHAVIPDPSQAIIYMNQTDGNPVSEEKDVRVYLNNAGGGKVYGSKRQNLDNGYTRFTFRFSVPEGLYVRVVGSDASGLLFDYYTAKVRTSSANNTLQVDIPNADLEGLSMFSIHFLRDENNWYLVADVDCSEEAGYYDLSKMSVLRLPDTLTTIEDETFENLACDAVIIPSSCTSIGSHAFRNCRNLKYAIIPANTTIAPDAFEGSNVWIEIIQGE